MNSTTKEARNFLERLPAPELRDWQQGVLHGIRLAMDREAAAEFTQALARRHGWRAFNEPKDTQARICLHCGQEFKSEGPRNRLCPTCRRIPDDSARAVLGWK